MRDADKMTGYGILFTPRVLCSLLLVWGTGCASSRDGQLNTPFSRMGESATVSNSTVAITNAIVLWSRTVTNGYVLYGDNDTRLNDTGLKTDPATLFLVRNMASGIRFWGNSACLPPEKSAYWANVIIRVLPVSEGNKVSVAIHGRHFMRGLAWNFHNFTLDHEKVADLPPCAQDERKVLNEILATLLKVGTK